MDDKQIFEEWKTFFINKGISKEYQESYLTYIDKLLSKNIPIIFEIEHLSLLLGRTTKYLNSVTFSPESHYREFQMKKRSGGFRTIDVPYPALLECQYWIYENILSKIKLN